MAEHQDLDMASYTHDTVISAVVGRTIHTRLRSSSIDALFHAVWPFQTLS